MKVPIKAHEITLNCYNNADLKFPLNKEMSRLALNFLDCLLGTEYDDEELSDSISFAKDGWIIVGGSPEDMLLDHMHNKYPLYVDDIKEAAIRRVVALAPKELKKEVSFTIRKINV